MYFILDMLLLKCRGTSEEVYIKLFARNTGLELRGKDQVPLNRAVCCPRLGSLS